jgi:hypothetical protein
MRHGESSGLPSEVHIPLPKDAIDLIEAARERGKPILGLDAFIVTETATEPLIGITASITQMYCRRLTLGRKLESLLSSDVMRVSYSRL